MKSLLPLLLPLLIVLGGCSKSPVAETENEEEKQQEGKPAKAAPVNPIKYKIAGDTVTITGCDRKASGALTIPATIEGKPVTSIGDKAFAYCSGLTSITIPDSVTSIGVRAFYKCSSLHPHLPRFLGLQEARPEKGNPKQPQPGRVRGKTSMKLNDLRQGSPVQFHKSN